MSAAIRAQVFPQKRVLAVLFEDGVSLWLPLSKLPQLQKVEPADLTGLFCRGHVVILPSGDHLHLADVVRAALDGHSWWAEKAEVIPCGAFCASADTLATKG
ncbi:MAG: DUF2442 domain-containing protein [Candidatus Sericytochromatia bacterium]|uniref:DUF2442 domain-containing protein n=1 Tax=Candidatus Tanganyikabacteria bacterium TaxID=2961651 RepID=A0A938BJW2_9BACT|nr:DUF2442 domain-containing protein [Candidatus Tanganyikabacteria bacterium]